MTSLTPSSVTAGAGATNVVINGSGFISSSTVTWGSTTHASTLISGAQIQVSLSAAEVASAGSAAVTVTNPSPGGGVSAAVTFTVNNPLPAISSVSPSTLMVGSSASSLTITGTGFGSSSVVNFSGSPRTTTFNSGTSLTVALTAADLQAAGAKQITVSNPTPGGGSSAAAAFSITNPVPSLSSISPVSVQAGSGDTTVTLAGTGFLSNSSVKVNGVVHASSYVSSTQLQVTLTASEVASPNAYQITVANAGPGGGSSYGANFSVNAAPAAIHITSMSPNAIPAGYGGFQLYIQASGLTNNVTVTWNGSPRPSYLDSYYGYLYVTIFAADVQSPGTAQIVVSDSVTGMASDPQSFTITQMGITSVMPNQIYAGAAATTLDVRGGGFVSDSIVQWNGAPLTTTFVAGNRLQAVAQPSDLAAITDAQVTVLNPDNSVSNAAVVHVIANPIPTAYSLNPISAAVGSGPVTVTIYGSNFNENSIVKMNSVVVPSTLDSSGELKVTLSAQLLQTFGTFTFTVTNPSPGGGTTGPLQFSTYLGLQTNDLVYNSWSGLLYVSTPSTAGSLGNRIVGIDPSTGNIVSSVFVGSEPNKMALSSDGKTMWVGIDGAAAVRKVDLVTMTAGLQFGLGGGPGVYNPPTTAVSLAVMPGFSDTVAVSTTNSIWSATGIRIFDSGVTRTNGYNVGSLPIVFDPLGTKLYAYDGGLVTMTIDATGVASSTKVAQSAYSPSVIRYDNGRIYTAAGTVLDSTNGNLLGTFYSGQNQANGWPAPDSANGKVFILSQDYSSTATIMSFDSSTFTSGTSLPSVGVNLNSYPYSVTSLVRWGQNGLAFRSGTQIYILQSNVVKDLTSNPADVKVAVNGPASSTTGSAVTYTVTITNNGPSAAHNVVLINSLPDNSTPGSVVAAQGTCVTGATARCNLGTIASGSSVQVTIGGTLLTSGTASDIVSVSAAEPDSNLSDNQATANTVVTGTAFNAPPTLSLVSPSFVNAGGPSFDITVSGAGFSSASSIRWNGSSLPTTFVDPNTLTATVDGSKIASLGYSWVDVNSPAPGGGTTAAVPVTFYAALGADVTRMIYDPFSRKIYASVPSVATQLMGNSVVAIDPATASMAPPVNVGSQPAPLALSDDGKYLFVGLTGSNSIARFNLATNAPDLTFGLGTDNSGGILTARGIAVAPGNPDLLAVDFGSWPGNGLIDIAGSTATRRTNFTGPYTGSSITFADATHVYTYDSDTSGAEFYRWNVTATGLTQIDGTTLNGMGGFQGVLQYVKGTVFGAGGGVVDPSTTPPSMIGKFSLNSPSGTAADPWNGRVFFLGCSTQYCGYPSTNALTAYDLSTYLPTNGVPLSFFGQQDNLLRWGSDGLAFRNSKDFSGSGNNQVILLRGPVVVPQLAVANPTGSLVSISPNSISAGTASGFYVTVTGTGFVAGATARWNGSDRTTYYIDSSHLSVAIPASDVVSAGTALVTVLNPGATSATSAVTFTIN